MLTNLSLESSSISVSSMILEDISLHLVIHNLIKLLRFQRESDFTWKGTVLEIDCGLIQAEAFSTAAQSIRENRHNDKFWTKIRLIDNPSFLYYKTEYNA